ncbi:hypothetical protein R6Z07M_016419 [Ovis aries]
MKRKAQTELENGTETSVTDDHRPAGSPLYRLPSIVSRMNSCPSCWARLSGHRRGSPRSLLRRRDCRALRLRSCGALGAQPRPCTTSCLTDLPPRVLASPPHLAPRPQPSSVRASPRLSSRTPSGFPVPPAVLRGALGDPGPMALQALQSSGVAFRKILSHFPEELSLAFAYGSGVYRQAGPSSD